MKYPTFGIVFWRDISASMGDSDLSKRKNLCLNWTIGLIQYKKKEKLVYMLSEFPLTEGYPQKPGYDISLPPDWIEFIIPISYLPFKYSKKKLSEDVIKAIEHFKELLG